jgi:hypothetical protein
VFPDIGGIDDAGGVVSDVPCAPDSHMVAGGASKTSPPVAEPRMLRAPEAPAVTFLKISHTVEAATLMPSTITWPETFSASAASHGS